ncbi:hypothetical protein [Paenibacillus alkalitolerans]|uniref:hypothetical protein n=1 Tax=Paenibacillus alkalitolerans TaxID=2799335 RepID=UPI0018F36DF3|nr:hypothetical protein [Paenibacillus alkalitolerans]
MGQDLAKQLERALLEIEQLKRENRQLKMKLEQLTGGPAEIESKERFEVPEVKPSVGTVHNHSAPSEKIALSLSILMPK